MFVINKQTLPILFWVMFLAATYFPLVFSAANTNSPSRVGSSLVFGVHGDVYPNGFFYTSVYIGNPPRLYFLDIDTGSDLTWVQCAAAPSTKLIKGPHPPYRPNNNVVMCKDPVCAFTEQCENPKDQCHYEVEYADNGSSLGVLIRDSFTIRYRNGSTYRPTLAFGCGYDQEFSGPHPPPHVDGVLGLANGKSSIVSQLGNMGLKNIFGHCFSTQGGGFLFIGDELIPSGVVWTSILAHPLNYYLSGPVDLLFGGKTPVAKGLNVIFDSGSTYTYLNSQAYQSTLTMVKRDLKGKQIKEVKDGNLPICWGGAKPIKSLDEVRNYFSPLVMSFTKANSVHFVLQPETYLILTSKGNVCLGIMNSAEANLGDLNVIGAISLQEKLLVYDNEKHRIGWIPSKCK